MDCIKGDINKKGVSAEMTADRGEWTKKHFVPTPLYVDKGRKIMMMHEAVTI